MNEPSHKPKRGLFSRLVIWSLKLAALMVAFIVFLTTFNMMRPLERPKYLDDPAAPGALVKVPLPERPIAQPQNQTALTSPTVQAKLAATSGTIAVTTTTQAMLITPGPNDPPERRRRIDEINAYYRQFAELLELYETDRAAYRALPASRKAPFGDWLPYEEREISGRMERAGLGREALDQWHEQYLKLLVRHGDWEPASEHVMKHPERYSLSETLYYARQCHGLVGPIRVAVYPGLRAAMSVADWLQRHQQEQVRTSPQAR